MRGQFLVLDLPGSAPFFVISSLVKIFLFDGGLTLHAVGTTRISVLILASLVASTKLKRRKKIVTNCSNSNFSIDVPISLFLQWDVVGIANVGECTDLAIPLAVL